MNVLRAETHTPSKSRRPFQVRSFGLTDRGLRRPANEDHFVVVELARTLTVRQSSVPQAEAQYSRHRGHVFIVADGIGGHKAGEVASALSVVTIEGFLLNTLNRFFNLKGTEEAAVLQEFQAALTQADAKIFEEAGDHPELSGMGTTLTMAFAVDWKLYVAHAGDCRAYLYSHGHLQQLTQDHTVAAEMIRRGALTPTEAAHNPFRHIVPNVVGGTKPGLKVELHKLVLEPGDVLLMCSDGLNEMVPDDRLAAALGEEPDPQRLCEKLIAQANANGGKDNTTVVAAVFGES